MLFDDFEIGTDYFLVFFEVVQLFLKKRSQIIIVLFLLLKTL